MSDLDLAHGSPIRLVLADDHPFVLMGLRLVFDQPGFEVVEACDNGARALAALREHRPDVLILDVQMPGLHGLDVLREMLQTGSATKVVVLTGSPDAEHIASAAKLGARGVLGKGEPPARLLECVRAVHAGGRWLELPEIPEPTASNGAGKLVEILTPRELQIVELIGKAMSNKAVGAKLGITEGTVKVHLHNIYEKLKVRGRMDLLLQFTKNP